MSASPTVHRIEVSAAPGFPDPIGDTLKRDAKALGIDLTASRASHVYLVQPASNAPISSSSLDAIRERLLRDPVAETSRLGASPAIDSGRIIEVHPLPGVMDPVAQSVQSAIQELLSLDTPPLVSTGWRYDLAGPGLDEAKARDLATRLLANPVIQKVHTSPVHPKSFPSAATHDGGMAEVRLIDLNDDQLTKLSRDAHLFLSLEEMHAVQAHYKSLGRNPHEIELETLAQTWSEHCVHKTLKSTVSYRGSGVDQTRNPKPETRDPIDWSNRPGHDLQPDGTVIIHNLLKTTVAAATKKLIADGVDWTLSVFVDNSGVIAFDDNTAVCIKVETHNHPSAIEPYGGAATGVGGCIRDVIATGLGARPIANTDVFCVAFPTLQDIPTGCLHPKRILTQVVSGVRDYGNRMGIPTVSGAVAFDDRYVGNPLVYCGCIGVMPRSMVHGQVQSGDLIVALGGRTGRDGIHGATFSSAELEHTATDEFAHAVQIGNAITEKQALDAIMRARDEFDAPLYHGMTDCGAGGFSSAIGEMGKSAGATVHLDKAPLKYAGLSATEIWISEAQERFVLAVPEKNLAKLQAICDEESVELAVLGTFAPASGSTSSNPDLALLMHGKEVGRLNMHFLHEGIPTPRREASWTPATPKPADRTLSADELPSFGEAVLALLSHPNIASKHWIIRQYDHEVRAGTAIKPLVGPLSRGPSDASVILPVPGSTRGLAISCGLQTGVGDPAIGGDPYIMTLAAIDECVRNLVSVGADPSRIAILDNFCWPSCKKPENLGSLVRAAEGCYDGALAYRTPFVSGKDSLNNQFTTQDGRTIETPPTLLITGIGIVHDINRCVTMDAKQPANLLLLVGATQPRLGGSHYQQLLSRTNIGLANSDLAKIPTVDLTRGPATANAVASIIANGLVASCHDVSDGGALCAVAEMLIAGTGPASMTHAKIGGTVNVRAIADMSGLDDKNADHLLAAAFGESPSRYVLEVSRSSEPAVLKAMSDAGIPCARVGELDASGRLSVTGAEMDMLGVDLLTQAWRSPLDW
jgi:phosphoribosylformylglycinamidine synthase